MSSSAVTLMRPDVSEMRILFEAANPWRPVSFPPPSPFMFLSHPLFSLLSPANARRCGFIGAVFSSEISRQSGDEDVGARRLIPLCFRLMTTRFFFFLVISGTKIQLTSPAYGSIIRLYIWQALFKKYIFFIARRKEVQPPPHGTKSYCTHWPWRRGPLRNHRHKWCFSPFL